MHAGSAGQQAQAWQHLQRHDLLVLAGQLLLAAQHLLPLLLQPALDLRAGQV
jgi:hypothetical protein